MNLLGISGLAGSGKDQTASFLVEDFNFVRISLADPMKRIASHVYCFSDEQLWGPSQFRNAGDPRYQKPDGSQLTPREVLQRLGTEMGRECYLNTWVDMCIRAAQKVLAPGSTFQYSQQLGVFENPAAPRCYRGVVIPDCRFKNEMAAIKAVGGKVIRVTRPGSGLGNERALHPSETEQASIPDQEFDHVIRNEGSLEDLRAKVLELMLKRPS